jgi:transposase
MTNRNKKLRQISPDWDLWQKLYYRHQQAYIRQRLLAIKYLWLGKSRPEVTQLLGCNYVTLTQWIDKFLSGGLHKLTEPITHLVPSRLNPEQQLELKGMLLEQKPTDYGIDRYIWTGKIISQVIQQKWGVELKSSRIYEILDELNLSHQKAHRDYANADSVLQKQFVDTLKKKLESRQPKEKIVFFDEFAVYDRPSLFYAWAEKNSRPQVLSNERRRTKVNGLLCVDTVTGEEYLRLTARARTEDIANYFAAFCRDSIQLGVTKLSVILDNNTTHKQKMQNLLNTQLQELGIQGNITVEFIYTPPYSPDFNLVEYLVHQLRLKVRSSQPVGMTIELVREKLEKYLQVNQLQTPEQIRNTIAHICSLAK